jgi:hypothetical protein
VPEPERAGLLVDFGGVLTTNVFASFAAFAEEEGLPRDHIADAFRNQPEPRELLFQLELGKLDAQAFEPRFAEAIGWRPTAPRAWPRGCSRTPARTTRCSPRCARPSAPACAPA